VGNVRTNGYAKFLCAPPHIKKASGIFGELITTTRTTRVAFWDRLPGPKTEIPYFSSYLHQIFIDTQFTISPAATASPATALPIGSPLRR